MEKTTRLSLEELKEKRENLGLSDYLVGGERCSGCLPCENYCHDAGDQ